MKVQYNRISTSDQNNARQIVVGIENYNDECSGTIPFKERKVGKRLWNDIVSGKVTEVNVHSIDRLGRNTLDILQTINDITAKGCNIVATKEGFSYLDEEGKVNMYAKVLVGILSTLSEMEYSIRKESQREGILKAKERGAYKANGRAKGSVIDAEVFLSKKTSVKAIKELKKGNSLRDAANLSEISLGTVQKIVKLCLERGIDIGRSK